MALKSFGGIFTKISTSLPSCCSFRATLPKMHKYVIPNSEFRNWEFAVNKSIYSRCDFIVFSFPQI